MNQQQIKYVRQRAEAILAVRQTELRRKYTTPTKRLTVEEKLEALRNGDFTISNDNPNQYYWYNSIVFKDEVIGGLDTKAHEVEFKKLQQEFDKLLDEVMLGDNEQALQLLRAFEAL